MTTDYVTQPEDEKPQRDTSREVPSDLSDAEITQEIDRISYELNAPDPHARLDDLRLERERRNTTKDDQ